MPLSRPLLGSLLALTWVAACRAGTTQASEAPAAAPVAEAAPRSSLARDWNYTVRSDAELTRLEVEACWRGPAPAAWVNPKDAADTSLVAARGPDGAPLEFEEDRIETAALGDDACIVYVVDLEVLDRNSGFMGSTSAGDTHVLSSSQWLWRPERRAKGAKVEAEFDLPGDLVAAVGWKALGPDRYRLDDSVFQMRSYTVFGRPWRRRFRVAESDFDVVMPALPRTASDEGIEAWLRAAGEAVATLYPGFATERLFVVVLPVPSRGDPVAFGMTARGGGPGLILLLGAGARDEELIGEWVAVHEMLHLGMPFVRSEDAWFSEGYATYYQQVVRARAGLLSPEPTPRAQVAEAVRALARGFERVDANVDMDLATASARMHQTRGYRQVYWGGAAFWFGLDVALRRFSEGQASADTFVRGLHSCCLAEGGIWSAEQLITRGSEVAEATQKGAAEIVTKRVHTALSAPGLPPVLEAFRAIGAAQSGEITQEAGAGEPSAALRASIFAPR